MKFPIFWVKNPDRFGNFLLGLAALLDGLIRVSSFGFLATRFQLYVAGWRMRRQFARQTAAAKRS